MNIDCFSPLLKRTTLLLSLMAGSFLLAACGGDSDSKSSTSSSVSSIASSLRSSFSAASVPANGSGVWPSVKVEAHTPKVLTFQWSAVEGATFYKLFKHDAATGGVVQVGSDLTSTSATDEIGVHVHDWVNNYYYVEACNAEGCSKSDLTFTATEMIKAIGYVKASNAEANDFFGWSIALSADGTTLAVGAPAEDSKAIGVNGEQANNDSTNSGAVYVFIKENNVWIQQAYLKASNTEQPNINSNRFLPNDRFGYKVELSDDGNTLAVSALLEDSPSHGVNCNENNYEVTYSGSSASDPSDDLIAAASYNVGAVYVFSRIEATWTQDAYVKPLYSLVHRSLEEGLRFGESIALSGDGKTLAVGATSDSLPLSMSVNYYDSSFSSNPSDVACFEYYPSSAASVSSSSSLSSSSSSVSSSASSRFPGGAASGAVYIFVKSAEGGWKEESYLRASNAEPSDAFGTSIALSQDGNTIAVGAIGEDGMSTGVNGDQASNGCYYYDLTATALVIDIACENAGRYFFRGLANNGAAYVFTRVAQIWTQEAYLKPSTPYWNTRFGYSIDLSGDGNTLGIGAPGDASNSTTVNGDATQKVEYANTGAAYIFTRAGTTWAQEAFVKPSTLTLKTGMQFVNNSDNRSGFIQTDGGGEFGGDISLSRDGNTLAAGSFRESSNALGVNGDQGDTSATRAGAVFVFTRANTVWSQKSYVKASNTDVDDRFGISVDLSADGKDMAVGAHRESTAASSDATSSANAEGAVYLY